jgi:hypothetical protein
MFLNPGGSVMDNEGPHCRNCHTGASTCSQCHNGRAATAWYGGTALLTESKSVASGDAYVHTNALVNVNAKCIDGGFSWPHRTLGKDLLKDELYGVDFAGNAIGVGGTRSTGATFTTTWLANYSLPWGQSVTSETATSAAGSILDSAQVNESGEQITATGGVENLDSVCIDCHGDATTWNGDAKSTYYSSGKGWELLWKGLP